MKGDIKIKGLTLDNRYFVLSELILFCQSEINARKEPDWKLAVYSFILDFLNKSENIIQKSSGSTGKCKNIELPKKSMLTSAKNTMDFFQLKKGDVTVLCLPIQYIAGKMMVVRALLSGMNLQLVEPSSLPDFSDIKRIDFCAMVPMQASNLLNKNLWPKIKTLILGGAETGQELLKQLQPLKTVVYETYGMAETCSHVALKKLNGIASENRFTALPDVQLSTNERGCLIIETSFLPKKIVTRDCAEMVSINQFKWLGRYDNTINSGGIKIQPETLEKQFQEILQKKCVFLGLPEETLGQKIVLVLETSESENQEQILAKLANHFDKKMLPKKIYLIKEFPRNKSFKVDRKRLEKIIQKNT